MPRLPFLSPRYSEALEALCKALLYGLTTVSGLVVKCAVLRLTCSSSGNSHTCPPGLQGRNLFHSRNRELVRAKVCTQDRWAARELWLLSAFSPGATVIFPVFSPLSALQQEIKIVAHTCVLLGWFFILSQNRIAQVCRFDTTSQSRFDLTFWKSRLGARKTGAEQIY